MENEQDILYQGSFSDFVEQDHPYALFTYYQTKGGVEEEGYIFARKHRNTYKVIRTKEFIKVGEEVFSIWNIQRIPRKIKVCLLPDPTIPDLVVYHKIHIIKTN